MQVKKPMKSTARKLSIFKIGMVIVLVGGLMKHFHDPTNKMQQKDTTQTKNNNLESSKQNEKRPKSIIEKVGNLTQEECFRNYNGKEYTIAQIRIQGVDDNTFIEFPMAVYKETETYSDIVSNEIVKNHKWEAKEVRQILLELAKLQPPSSAFPPPPEPIFIDVGANIGVYSLAVAASGYTSYAIEPFESNLELLQLSACINKNNNNNNIAKNLILIPYGLSTEKKSCEMWQIPKLNIGSAITICNEEERNEYKKWSFNKVGTMNTTTIDTLISTSQIHIDNLNIFLGNNENSNTNNDIVMKLDIEGYEPYALMGGKEILLKHIPPKLIQTEYSPWMLNLHDANEPNLAVKFIKMMQYYGYGVFGLRSGRKILDSNRNIDMNDLSDVDRYNTIMEAEVGEQGDIYFRLES